jgi:hypothetical protein
MTRSEELLESGARSVRLQARTAGTSGGGRQRCGQGKEEGINFHNAKLLPNQRTSSIPAHQDPNFTYTYAEAPKGGADRNRASPRTQNLHNNPPRLSTTATLLPLFLRAPTAPPPNLHTLNLNPSHNTLLLLPNTFRAMQTIVIRRVIDTFKHARETLMAFALLLFLGLRRARIVGVFFCGVGRLELSFSLSEAEGELAAGARWRYLKGRWGVRL